MFSLPLLLALPLSLAAPDADGKYWLSANGIQASFIPYGASLSNLIINDQYGIPRDLVAGFDNASYYSIDRQHPHFGGVPGRYANRIRNSSFAIDNTTYHVLPNEHPVLPDHPDGVDTLHGGPHGWDYRNFTVVSHSDRQITFSLLDPDGSQGFPGDVLSYVTYTVADDASWHLHMTAFALTRPTPIMLSSHVYWNLDGFANNRSQTVFDHALHLPYSRLRVATDSILVPTGDLLAIQPASAHDFWSSDQRTIGDGFRQGNELLGSCGDNCTGYDNCYLVQRDNDKHIHWKDKDNYVARLHSPWSGIQLDVFTDQHAFQVYSCSGMNGSVALKKTQGLFGDDNDNNGHHFPRTIPQYGCLVMEVEDWIDGINQPAWNRKQVYGPNDPPYELQATYKFSIRKDGGE